MKKAKTIKKNRERGNEQILLKYFTFLHVSMQTKTESESK